MKGFIVLQHNHFWTISEIRGYDYLDFPGVRQDDYSHGGADVIEPLETKGFKYSFLHSFNFVKFLLQTEDDLKTNSTLLNLESIWEETGKNT